MSYPFLESLKSLSLKTAGLDDNIVCPVCGELCENVTDNTSVYSAPTFERCPHGHYEVVCNPVGVVWDEFFAKGFNLHRNIGEECTLITQAAPPAAQPRDDIYNIRQSGGATRAAIKVVVPTARVVAAITTFGAATDAAAKKVKSFLVGKAGVR